MYAETDLDQPTDYSLRYAENDSDLDCRKETKSEPAEFVQDTIKTYCTEDTPYETPFNFSTSTSLTDLRIDDKQLIDGTKIPVRDNKGLSINNPRNKPVKSSFSSGLMTPEKPVNYCEEGTPGYLSRVASCGSLNLIVVNDSSSKAEDKDEKEKQRRTPKVGSEVKAVKFEEVVNYSEETPLMFSRSSSLASLDSIEQHSIHDDRSSVVSDFSRLTSGLISPSDLPDSPTETLPPSLKPKNDPAIKAENDMENVPKATIFEDCVKNYNIECTPIQYSTATSLSNLTIDETDSKLNHSNQPTKEEENNDLNADLSESSEDDDMLAACINIGIQNNRYSQAKKTSDPLRLDITNDCLKTYCTEDTPAILSHAGSNSDLSSLSFSLNETKHLNNSLESGDNSHVLQNVTVIHNKSILSEVASSSSKIEIEDSELSQSQRSSFISISDSDHALLQDCILAGMSKNNRSSNTKTPSIDSSQDDAKIALNLSHKSSSAGSLSNQDSLELTKTEEGLLKQCILSGIYERINNRKVSPQQQLYNMVSKKVAKNLIAESDDSSEEENAILDNCIKHRIKCNKYNNHAINSKATIFNGNSILKRNVPIDIPRRFNIDNQVVNDSVRSYCTEDTPAILSHAGSNTDLSVLSLNDGGRTSGEGFLSDDSNGNKTDDEEMLKECVKFGMAVTLSANKHKTDAENNLEAIASTSGTKLKVDLNISVESNVSDESQSSLSFSEDSYQTEQGLSKKVKSKELDMPEANDLTDQEQKLLQQCILEGMQKCSISSPSRNVPQEDDSNDLTATEKDLLRQCIIAGMPKSRPSSAVKTSKSHELTYMEPYILGGIPKRSSNFNLKQYIANNQVPNQLKKQKKKTTRYVERSNQNGNASGEHSCCIHCPKNNPLRLIAKQHNQTKSRRKNRGADRGQVQIRDVNILYVTGKILSLKKDLGNNDNSREEWI